jgi:hypothetical protein
VDNRPTTGGVYRGLRLVTPRVPEGGWNEDAHAYGALWTVGTQNRQDDGLLDEAGSRAAADLLALGACSPAEALVR